MRETLPVPPPLSMATIPPWAEAIGGCCCCCVETATGTCCCPCCCCCCGDIPAPGDCECATMLAGLGGAAETTDTEAGCCCGCGCCCCCCAGCCCIAAGLPTVTAVSGGGWFSTAADIDRFQICCCGREVRTKEVGGGCNLSVGKQKEKGRIHKVETTWINCKQLFDCSFRGKVCT